MNLTIWHRGYNLLAIDGNTTDLWKFLCDLVNDGEITRDESDIYYDDILDVYLND